MAGREPDGGRYAEGQDHNKDPLDDGDPLGPSPVDEECTSNREKGKDRQEIPGLAHQPTVLAQCENEDSQHEPKDWCVDRCERQSPRL